MGCLEDLHGFHAMFKVQSIVKTDSWLIKVWVICLITLFQPSPQKANSNSDSTLSDCEGLTAHDISAPSVPHTSLFLNVVCQLPHPNNRTLFLNFYSRLTVISFQCSSWMKLLITCNPYWKGGRKEGRKQRIIPKKSQLLHQVRKTAPSPYSWVIWYKRFTAPFLL